VQSTVTAGRLDADGIPERQRPVGLHRTRVGQPIGAKIPAFDTTMSHHHRANST
jgi:hypothetical protein